MNGKKDQYGSINFAHHKLNNLTVFVDHNNFRFGYTKDTFNESTLGKVKGFDITISVIDGHNLEEIRLAAFQKKNVTVFMKTIWERYHLWKIKWNGIIFL